MRRFTRPFGFLLLLGTTFGCETGGSKSAREKALADSLKTLQIAQEKLEAEQERERLRDRTKEDITLRKELTYDNYTLEDTYTYDGTDRMFQWEKIKERLAIVENFQRKDLNYGVLQNHRNKNGESPVVRNFVRNAYTRVSDTLGTERYQSAPLYEVGDQDRPIIYGRDGSLVAVLSADTLDYVRIAGLSFDGEWEVPKRYLKTIGTDVRFEQIIVVDVTNQNITTLEKGEDEGGWIIRSMNPATTGVHQPPYAHETPLGMFVIQEKKETMYFLKDGTRDEIAGFAPYASRFSNGGYIHGVPVNYPRKTIIEHSWSLGTVPRSHMCVRNVSSHAKFIYDWAETLASLLFVIE